MLQAGIRYVLIMYYIDKDACMRTAAFLLLLTSIVTTTTKVHLKQRAGLLVNPKLHVWGQSPFCLIGNLWCTLAFSLSSLVCLLYFLGVPMLPPPQDRAEGGKRGSSGNPLRDFMLKSHDGDTQGPQTGPPREPRYDGHPSHESPAFPSSPFSHWSPFSKVFTRYMHPIVCLCYYRLLFTVSTLLFV